MDFQLFLPGTWSGLGFVWVFFYFFSFPALCIQLTAESQAKFLPVIFNQKEKKKCFLR